MMSRTYFWRIVVYIVAGMSAYLAAGREYTVLAAGILMVSACLIYAVNVYESGSIISLRGMLGLSWLGGMGLACLRLSQIQKEWADKTWLCMLVIYPVFSISYSLQMKRMQKKAENKSNTENRGPDAVREAQNDRVFGGIVLMTVVSAVCFIIEAVILGYIPLFADTGHAYLEFHISGVHYFTVQCVMVPALSVLYMKEGNKSRKRMVLLAVCNLTAVLIPIVCVSRFHLIFAATLAGIVYLSVYQKGTWKTVLCVTGLLIPTYILLSMARNQSADYLNQVFEMRNIKIPVWISQPYMYITSNYDNFNCMVENMSSHLYDGARMLYPFFALTGLKFLIPVQISRPPYTVKAELSTFTMFYDAYYDFGMVGLLVFTAVLGVLSAVLVKYTKQEKNPVIHMFYGQIGLYFMLSFFTTWFSNPTVWFRLIMTGILYMAVGKCKKG